MKDKERYQREMVVWRAEQEKKKAAARRAVQRAYAQQLLEARGSEWKKVARSMAALLLMSSSPQKTLGQVRETMETSMPLASICLRRS